MKMTFDPRKPPTGVSARLSAILMPSITEWKTIDLLDLDPSAETLNLGLPPIEDSDSDSDSDSTLCQIFVFWDTLCVFNLEQRVFSGMEVCIVFDDDKSDGDINEYPELCEKVRKVIEKRRKFIDQQLNIDFPSTAES